MAAGSSVRGEEGLTLLEIIIAMTIGTFLLGAISAAVIAAFDVTGVATASLTQTNDRQLVQIWFPRDVQSAQTATPTAPPACAAAQGLTHGPKTPTTAVVSLKGNGERFVTTSGVTTVQTSFYEADYVLEVKSGSSAGARLVRYFCFTPSSSTLSCTSAGSKCTTHEIVSFDLTTRTLLNAPSAKATVTGTNRTTVKLTITERPTTTTHVKLGHTKYSILGWERS